MTGAPERGWSPTVQQNRTRCWNEYGVRMRHFLAKTDGRSDLKRALPAPCRAEVVVAGCLSRMTSANKEVSPDAKSSQTSRRQRILQTGHRQNGGSGCGWTQNAESSKALSGWGHDVRAISFPFLCNRSSKTSSSYYRTHQLSPDFQNCLSRRETAISHHLVRH
jgi:hypothetical protein